MKLIRLLSALLLGALPSLAFAAAATFVPPVMLGPGLSVNTTLTTATLDANGEYWSFITRAPKTGTIDRIHFMAAAVTANGDGLRVRIETVDAATGLPSGTLVGGSSEVTHTTTTASTWNRGTAGLAAAVTAGDIIAIKLMSPAAGTTFNGVLNIGTNVSTANSLSLTSGFPYVVNAVPTATKASSATASIAIEYDDGTTPAVLGTLPINAMAQPSFNTGSTPDERGNLFQVPFPVRAIGVAGVAFGGASGATFEIVLYDASSSALATVTADPDIGRLVGSPAIHEFRFGTPVSLSANTNYRVVIKPTSGTSSLLTTHTIDTSAGGTRLREAMINSTWKLTTRTDAGAWTDTDDSFAHLGLLVDQFDDGTGGGGSVAINPLSGPVN